MQTLDIGIAKERPGSLASLENVIDMSKELETFPVKAEGDVVLRDGSTAHVRMMRPGDEQGLLSLFESLSDESRWYRFFSPAKGSALAAEAHREVNLDHTFGLLALSGAEERVVGHAFYAVLDEASRGSRLYYRERLSRTWSGHNLARSTGRSRRGEWNSDVSRLRS